MNKMVGQRIIVTGTSGSGKTTLAKQLADQLHAKHIELDALFWNPNWTEASLEVFRARVQDAIASDYWVMDGNYGKVRDLTWQRADTIIWLDYPLWLVLWRVTKRTLFRTLFRQTLWHGNIEPLSRMFSRDSIILWALTSHQRRKREFQIMMARSEYAHLRFIRLSSPHMTSRWLATVCPQFSP